MVVNSFTIMCLYFSLTISQINADRNFELVSIAAPPFMLASTTSLVSEFDKLNCSVTERKGIFTEDEIPLELTKCKQADGYISQFLRPQGESIITEYEIPQQEYTESKQPDDYIAQPFKVPRPSTDTDIKSMEQPTMERCHGEYKESNSPYIEEQSGSITITVTDNTDSQVSANSCSDGYVPDSFAKESTFKHSRLH